MNITFVSREAVISVWFVRSSSFMLKEESFNEMKDCTKNTASVVEKRSVHGAYAFNLTSKNVLNCSLLLKVVKIRCPWC